MKFTYLLGNFLQVGLLDRMYESRKMPLNELTFLQAYDCDNDYKISQRKQFVKRFKSLAGGDLFNRPVAGAGTCHAPLQTLPLMDLVPGINLIRSGGDEPEWLG